MTKRKKIKDKQRSIKHYTKLKIEKHEPHSKPGMNSCAPDR